MSTQVLHSKLLGQKKLIAIQNQIQKVVDMIYEQRKKEFLEGRSPTRPTRTLVYNEALKKGLEFMTGMQKPLDVWQPEIFGVLVAPSMFIPQEERRIAPNEDLPIVSDETDDSEGEEL